METKSYKLWHLLIAFLLGVVIAVGVLLVPSYGGEGFLSKDLFSKPTVPDAGDMYELNEKFDNFTTQFESFTKEFVPYIKEIEPEMEK